MIENSLLFERNTVQNLPGIGGNRSNLLEIICQAFL